MSKAINTAGTRKRAVARITLVPGTGRIMINNVGLDHYGNQLNRARIMEPVILAGEIAKKFDINVRVFGGGATGQADAIRLGIARAFAQNTEKLRSIFLEYDRMLLVADVRRKEPAKPNSHGQARSKTQKSYR